MTPSKYRKRLLKVTEKKLLAAEQSQLSSAMIAQALMWHYKVAAQDIPNVVRNYLTFLEQNPAPVPPQEIAEEVIEKEEVWMEKP